MTSKDVEGIQDIVNGTKYDNHGSAQEEYYRNELLRIKLLRDNTLSTVEKEAILQATSEREGIELRILAKLSAITESSPEFAQVVDLTGTKDKFEQAKRLAEVTYDRIRAQQVLSFYTPEEAVMKQHFRARTLPAALARTTAVYNSASGNVSIANSILEPFARTFGIAIPGVTVPAAAEI